MKHLLPGAILLSLAACGDVPTLEVGGGGARFLNGQPRDVVDAYVMAYSNLSPSHLRVRLNLEPRGRNMVGARAAMERIIDGLETMRALVTPEGREAFEPYVARYREWLRDLERETWGGSFLNEFEAAEREVKSKFRVDKVELAQPVAEAPPAPAPAPERATAVPAMPADKVEVPPSAAGPRKPAGEKAPAAAEAPPRSAAPGSPELARIYFKAYDRAHDDLVEAYKAKKDCSVPYKDLADALRLLKDQVTGERATTVQVYSDYYAGIHKRTDGFKVLPEKTTEKDVVDELNVAARVLRQRFSEK